MNNNLVFETKKYTNPECPLDLSFKSHSAQKPIKNLYTRHYHKEMEILCVTKGALSVVLESCIIPLEAGDLIVIEPGLVHYTVKSVDVEYVCAIFPIIPHVINIYPECCEIFLGQIGITDKFLQNISRFPEIKKKCTDIISEMLSVKEKNEKGNLLFISASIQKLLFHILQVLEEKSPKEETKIFNYAKIIPAVEYISKNFNKKIQIKELAVLCHYNVDYFSRGFKKLLGMTIVEYINFERYKYAKMCLLESKATVSEIAQKSGFSSEKALYGYFKKTLGMTPSEFRNKNSIL